MSEQKQNMEKGINNAINTPSTEGKRIVIAGGGTGGHIFPAIAIANAIKKIDPAIQFLFIGANGKMEMEKVPQAGFSIKGIDIAGFNRSSILKNLGLPYKMVKSYLQVKSIMKDFKPDAAIGVGGYSTFPVLKYAQRNHIPTFIHESNSFAGKANKMLGKEATRIFVAGKGMEKFFPASKIQITGNPVRSLIAENNIDKNTALQYFNLKPGKKTVLSVGGSLGAGSINLAIANNIKVFESNALQLIWQTGKLFSEKAAAVAGTGTSVFTSDFIKEMNYAFAAADIVISRAGAMAIAEICIIGKPAILVPYPYAAEDHQTANAAYLVKNNAAILIKDDQVQEQLMDTVIALAKNEAHQKEFAENSKKLAIHNADKIIAEEILKYLRHA